MIVMIVMIVVTSRLCSLTNNLVISNTLIIQVYDTILKLHVFICSGSFSDI